MRSWRKWLLSILVVLVGMHLLFSLTFFILGKMYHDIPPVDDSDLLVSIAPIPDEHNAYFTLSQFDHAGLVLTRDDKTNIRKMVNGDAAWDVEAAAAMLHANTAALALFDAASTQPFYRGGQPYDVEDVRPEFQLTPLDQIDIIYLDALRVMRNFPEHPDRAIDGVRQMLRTAQLFVNEPPTILGVAVGMSAKKVAMRVLQWMATRAFSQPAEWWRQQDALVAAMQQDVGAIRFAIRTEYTKQAQFFDSQVTPRYLLNEGMSLRLYRLTQFSPGYFFQPNRSRLMIAELQRNCECVR